MAHGRAESVSALVTIIQHIISSSGHPKIALGRVLKLGREIDPDCLAAAMIQMLGY